jgi:hypothetical protein
MQRTQRKAWNILVFFGVLALWPLLSGCPGVIELKSKVAKGGPGKSTVAPILYDDFEKGVNGVYAYGNTDGGGSCGASEEDQVVHGGSKALKNSYKSGSGSWGCGFGWSSSYMPKEGYFNAKGTLGIEFWAKAPRGASFQLSIKEAKANGGDEEVYLAPASTGTGAWKKYYLTYDTFSRGIYSGNQAGDDVLEIGAIASMEFQFDSKQGDGIVYIDDIYFK